MFAFVFSRFKIVNLLLVFAITFSLPVSPLELGRKTVSHTSCLSPRLSSPDLAVDAAGRIEKSRMPAVTGAKTDIGVLAGLNKFFKKQSRNSATLLSSLFIMSGLQTNAGQPEINVQGFLLGGGAVSALFVLRGLLRKSRLIQAVFDKYFWLVGKFDDLQDAVFKTVAGPFIHNPKLLSGVSSLVLALKDGFLSGIAVSAFLHFFQYDFVLVFGSSSVLAVGLPFFVVSFVSRLAGKQLQSVRRYFFSVLNAAGATELLFIFLGFSSSLARQLSLMAERVSAKAMLFYRNLIASIEYGFTFLGISLVHFVLIAACSYGVYHAMRLCLKIVGKDESVETFFIIHMIFVFIFGILLLSGGHVFAAVAAGAMLVLIMDTVLSFIAMSISAVMKDKRNVLFFGATLLFSAFGTVVFYALAYFMSTLMPLPLWRGAAPILPVPSWDVFVHSASVFIPGAAAAALFVGDRTDTVLLPEAGMDEAVVFSFAA